MQPLKLVFAGTPEFSLPCLRVLLDGSDTVQAVYTQPDRPAGRGRQLSASPVKRLALGHGIEVRQPRTLRDAEAQAALRELQPDLMIVIAYGLILPQAVLDIPRHGSWNVHASLLPRWRGAAPIQRAIQAGDSESGVCLMQMEKGLDTGPVMLTLRTPITPDETAGSLHDRLAELGAEVLRDALKLLRNGMPPAAQAQPDEGATYAHKLDKAEAVLDLSLPAFELARTVRAFQPWPVAEIELFGERLRVHAAEALSTQHDAQPGSELAASAQGLDLACGDGALRLLRVQRAGGKPIAIGDFLNARRVRQ